jgi:hypothetical protein
MDVRFSTFIATDRTFPTQCILLCYIIFHSVVMALALIVTWWRLGPDQTKEFGIARQARTQLAYHAPFTSTEIVLVG